MSKFKSILIFFTSIIFLQGCSTIKEGFSSQKKGSTDEFLVEKKSPLVMPPEFNDLPNPNSIESENIDTGKNIKKFISNNNSTNDISINQDKDFEISIIDKIKQNQWFQM